MYDIVITMTGLDMARMKKGVRIRATSGYAYGKILKYKKNVNIKIIFY